MLFVALMAMVAFASRPARIVARERRQERRKGAAVKLTLADLRDLARGVGFPEETLDTAAAVAMAESGGDPGAMHIVTSLQAAAMHQLPERSFGLWQVNTLAHTEYDEGKLLIADYAARAAFVLSRGGLDWHAWSTHNPGPHGEPAPYLKFMPGGAAYV